MSHSVPPPEPPPIVQSLPSATLVSDVPLSFSVSQSVTASPVASPPQLAKTLSPQPHALNAAKDAALLGAPISTGYGVEQIKTVNSVDSSAAEVDRAIATSRNGSPDDKLQKGKPIRAGQLRNSQPISPFRPSTSALVNKLLASQKSLSVAQSDRPTDSNNTSQLPNTGATEFNFQAPTNENQPTTAPIPSTPVQPVPSPVTAPTPQPSNQPSGQNSPPGTSPTGRRVVEVTSDRQEYDQERQIVTAEGNVVVRFDGTVLDADRLQVNLPNLIAVGEGNVAFASGQQRLRGQRFTYNFVQNSGNLQSGSGEIFIPSAGSDFSGTLPTDVTAGGVPPRPESARVTANQPLQQVSSPGSIGITLGSGRNTPQAQEGGTVKRLRFEAEQIDFYPEGWQADNVRITNDPFSPPELELRADKVTLTRETPERDRIRTTRQRLVFDQGFSLPIPRNQAVIDRRQRDTSPGLAQIGYDGTDRGGLYIERGFTLVDTDAVQFSIKPQFFVQKTIQENGGNPFDPSLFGLKANLNGTLGPRTALRGAATFTSLDLGDLEENVRARVGLQQLVGTRLPHTLSFEYAYRDRIYNGTLGFRTVRSSIGGLIASPSIPLGKTGINLSYAAGAQYITADSDRAELLEPVRESDRISLGRFQGSAALSRGFVLWQGKGLPATATEGLRYTPAPVVPNLTAYAGVTGVTSFYTSGDNQSLLIGTVGLGGQFGHLSRKFLDYTRFNISYSQGIRSGLSPFLFDRAADTSVLSVGLTQQIYGPFLLGIQTAVNLDTGESLSTEYSLEYSRRTYGVILRYNPVQELGSISFRLSDFNWSGGTDPFSDSEIRPVVGGVRRENPSE